MSKNGNSMAFLEVRSTRDLVGRITGQIIAKGTIGRVVNATSGYLIVDFGSRMSVARVEPNSEKIEIVRDSDNV